MASQKQKVYAGFFIFLAIALLLTTVAVIERRFDKGQAEFRLVFPEDMSVTGLKKGAPVKYKGVPVGTVGEISLVEGGDDSAPGVVAMLLIDKDYISYVGLPDVRGELVFQGLSGSLGIDLFISKEDTGALPGKKEWAEGEPPIILAVESGLGEILNNTPILLKEMGELARTLNGVIDHNKAHFGSTLAGVDLLMTQGAPRMIALLDELDRFIRYTEVRVLKPGGALDRMESALSDNLDLLAREVSGSVDQVASSASRTLQGIEDPVLETLAVTRIGLTELRTLIVEMHDLLTTNRRAFSAMMAEVRDASEAVERVMLEVESNPSALIFGEPAKDGSKP